MIFFDEAGNSGANLLDKDQPIFVLLSHDYSLAECQEILQPLTSLSKAKELHFKTLKKSTKYQKALIDCLNHPLIGADSIYYYLAHKEFMVSIHMVDQLVELVTHHQGIDLYKGGSNLSTANILHIMGKNVWDRELYEKMCSAFVAWLRTNERIKALEFYKTAIELYRTIKDDEDKMLVGLILESHRFVETIETAHSKYTLDATLSCFIAHCNFWADKYKAPFDVTFDNSKQIDYWRDMITFLTEQLPAKEVGYGSRKHKYPLLINSLKLVDSSDHFQVQFTDVLASSLNYAWTCRLKGLSDHFAEDIINSRLTQASANVMWPTTAMTPEDLDMLDESGSNALDFIAEHLHQRKENTDYAKAP